MRVQNKARYIPEGYAQIAKDKALGIEVWANKDRLVAIGYAGKRMKPDFNYRFKDLERLEQYVAEYVIDVIAQAKLKEKRRAEKAEANRNAKIEIGDILKASWGYDQTNIDYYEVVGIKNQMVEVREIGKVMEREDQYGDRGRCAPAPGQYKGPAKRYKIQAYGNNVYIRISSYATADKIEPIAVVAGAKIYQTSYWSSYA